MIDFSAPLAGMARAAGDLERTASRLAAAAIRRATSWTSARQ
jgi:hypothetical protein